MVFDVSYYIIGEKLKQLGSGIDYPLIPPTNREFNSRLVGYSFRNYKYRELEVLSRK